MSAKEHTVQLTLQPGPVGLEADWETGEITRVLHGQCAKLDVKEGWYFHKIDGAPYSVDMLDAKSVGESPYEITFLTQESTMCMPMAAHDLIEDAEGAAAMVAPLAAVYSSAVESLRQQSQLCGNQKPQLPNLLDNVTGEGLCYYSPPSSPSLAVKGASRATPTGLELHRHASVPSVGPGATMRRDGSRGPQGTQAVSPNLPAVHTQSCGVSQSQSLSFLPLRPHERSHPLRCVSPQRDGSPQRHRAVSPQRDSAIDGSPERHAAMQRQPSLDPAVLRLCPGAAGGNASASLQHQQPNVLGNGSYVGEPCRDARSLGEHQGSPSLDMIPSDIRPVLERGDASGNTLSPRAESGRVNLHHGSLHASRQSVQRFDPWAEANSVMTSLNGSLATAPTVTGSWCALGVAAPQSPTQAGTWCAEPYSIDSRAHGGPGSWCAPGYVSPGRLGASGFGGQGWEDTVHRPTADKHNPHCGGDATLLHSHSAPEIKGDIRNGTFLSLPMVLLDD